MRFKLKRDNFDKKKLVRAIEWLSEHPEFTDIRGTTYIELVGKEKLLNNDKNYSTARCRQVGIDTGKFLIIINENISESMMLRCLFHEAAHAKQFAKNQMFNTTHGYVWNGVIQKKHTTFFGYWKLPWEIDARKYERNLYVEFHSTSFLSKMFAKFQCAMYYLNYDLFPHMLTGVR